MTPAQQRGAAAGAVGLLAVGAALLFLASAVAPRPSGAGALALVSLAGSAAVLAARGWMRRLVGSLLVIAGVAAMFLGLVTAAWWAVLGGLATTAGGGWTAWRGSAWSRMSQRYERAGAVPPGPGGSTQALWDALDRGEDPTADRDDLPE